MKSKRATSYDKTPRVYDGDEICDLCGFPKGRGKFFERAEEYGWRAWRVKGSKQTLIVWDVGNGWYSIIRKEE